MKYITGKTGIEIVTGTSKQMGVNMEYVASSATLLTFTLPATCPVGSRLSVIGMGAGGWKIA